MSDEDKGIWGKGIYYFPHAEKNSVRAERASGIYNFPDFPVVSQSGPKSVVNT